MILVFSYWALSSNLWWYDSCKLPFLQTAPGNTKLISLSATVKLAADGNFQIPSNVIEECKKHAKVQFVHHMHRLTHVSTFSIYTVHAHTSFHVCLFPCRSPSNQSSIQRAVHPHTLHPPHPSHHITHHKLPTHSHTSHQITALRVLRPRDRKWCHNRKWGDLGLSMVSLLILT